MTDTGGDWRFKRIGPPGFKVGRTTKYAAADVEAWLAEQKRKTTVGDELPSGQDAA
jgi:hypothetical protein